jgi:hypothetical protein
LKNNIFDEKKRWHRFGFLKLISEFSLANKKFSETIDFTGSLEEERIDIF